MPASGGNDLSTLLTAAARKKITETNQKNVKSLENGGKAEYHALKNLVIIGVHPAPEAKAILVEIKRQTAMYSHGILTVTKGSIASKGELKAAPAPKDRPGFETAIKTFSDKKVRY